MLAVVHGVGRGYIRMPGPSLPQLTSLQSLTQLLNSGSRSPKLALTDPTSRRRAVIARTLPHHIMPCWNPSAAQFCDLARVVRSSDTLLGTPRTVAKST